LRQLAAGNFLIVPNSVPSPDCDAANTRLIASA
jgi:hypothetical protein